MADFKRGILIRPVGQRCMEDIENTEPVQFVRR